MNNYYTLNKKNMHTWTLFKEMIAEVGQRWRV